MRRQLPLAAPNVDAGPDAGQFDVTRKQIKHLYIRVHRDTGQVSVTAPGRMSDFDVLEAVRRHWAWIEKRRSRIRSPQTVSPLGYVTGEQVTILGTPYRLRVQEVSGRRSCAKIVAGCVEIWTKPGATAADRATLLDELYRQELKRHIPALISYWQARIGARVAEWRVRKMQTRWGSCNPRRARIWISLRLAAYPPECLECVVVHEMAHLIVPDHSPRFYALLNDLLPEWKQARDVLRGEGHS
jgi:predicted metal-dependent hydrolase